VKRVIDLTLRVADGTATDAELRELERLTEADRRARRMHLEMMEIEAALRASRADFGEVDRSLAEERTVNAVMAGVRLRPPPRPQVPRFAARPIWAVLALAGVAASATLMLWPSGPAKRRGAAPSSSFAFGRSRIPAEGAPLPASPRSNGWSSAPMRIHPAGTPEVSRLELGEGLVLEIRGRTVVRALEVAGHTRRLLVDEGSVSIEGPADRAPSPLLVVTPQGEVTARARKAVLSVTPEATRIDLHDGMALVKRTSDGRSVELASLQSALVTPNEALAAVALPSALFLRGQSVGRHPTDLLDAALARHLEGLGFAVEAVDENDLMAGHVEGKALVMISPSTSGILRNRIEELSLDRLAVPIICSRPHLYPDLSMGPGQSGHFVGNATRLSVIEPNHPLSGGYAGPLQVTRAPGSLGWGQPGPGAVRVATFPDTKKNDLAVIFAYERGAPMTGPLSRAPARRVGFFMHPDLAPYLTESGWALLDAAVRWATEE